MEERTKDPLQGSTRRHPVVEELLHRQVAGMRRRGSSRAVAEQFVLRFQAGRNYLHVVDEVYPREEPEAEPDASPELGGSRKPRKFAVLRSLLARN